MPFDDMSDDERAAREQEWEEYLEREWDKVCGACVLVIDSPVWDVGLGTEAFCIGVKGHPGPGHLIATENLAEAPPDILKRMLPMHEKRPF